MFDPDVIETCDFILREPAQEKYEALIRKLKTAQRGTCLAEARRQVHVRDLLEALARRIKTDPLGPTFVERILFVLHEKEELL